MTPTWTPCRLTGEQYADLVRLHRDRRLTQREIGALFAHVEATEAERKELLARVDSLPAGQGTVATTAPADSGTSHSPLPWQFTRGLCDGELGQWYDVWNPNPAYPLDPHLRQSIAMVCSGGDYIENMHNARFIVTACNAHDELLAALKHLSVEVSALLGIAERELRDAVGNTNVAVLTQRWQEARAALAKAEGH
jgi:hypothetical protein